MFIGIQHILVLPLPLHSPDVAERVPDLQLKMGFNGQNQGGGWKQGREVGLAGVRGVVGRKCRQL